VNNHYLKDLKKAYRILRKEKNEYKKGDQKRIELNKKMKEIKEKIQKESGETVITDPIKIDLINKITKFKKDNNIQIFNMDKFSVEDLEFHYLKITGKVITKAEYYKLKGIEAPVQTASPSFKRETEEENEENEELTSSHSPIEAGIRRIRRK